ncbi:MAG TPA: alkaline phosphatase D family protein, partial [Chitinophagales bacterium]|nr:alkaline phosphatase D family protein [Chitinophagales bacterium]
VTPSSVRMYVRTSAVAEVKVEVSTDFAFTNPISVTDSTQAWRDTAIILGISGLNANTLYHYRVYVNGVLDTLRGSFKTFPAVGQKGHYKWGVLSCQEFGTYNTFKALYNRQPQFVLHTGDWTYPDYQLPGDHRTDWGIQQLSWLKRYTEQNMIPSLRSAVYDYVPDNHDGAEQRDNQQFVSSYVDSNGTVHNVVTPEPVPPVGLQNVFKAYYEYFPGYPAAIDSSKGMYHSYRFGNAEVFFVDGRHCGNGQDSTFTYDAQQNKWIFDPKPGQTLLGAEQLQWLKTGLQQSTADWKFIVSGVMFNRNFRKVIQVAMVLQNAVFGIGGQTGTGFTLAHAIANNWCAYPVEQDGLLDFIHSNAIKDIIVLSGHVHTNVMDNGYNAGLPELNTGPAAGSGAELTYYIDSVMQLIGQGTAIDSLWNGGGQGVNNKNFKSGFGMVEIFNSDSVVMQIVDEDDTTVSSMTILHSSIAPTSIPVIKEEACVIEKIFPNVTSDKVQVKFCQTYNRKAGDRSYLIDLNGRILSIPVNAETFSVKGLPAGKYLYVYDYGPEVKTMPLQVVY